MPAPSGPQAARSPGERQTIADVLRRAGRLMLASAVGGNPSATALPCVADGDGVLFVCPRMSRAAAQLGLNPAAQALLFDADTQRGVELSGFCRELADAATRDAAAQRLGERLSPAATQDLRTPGPGRFALFRLEPTRSALFGASGEDEGAGVDFPQNVPRSSRLVLAALGSELRLWVRAVRAPFFTAAVVPMLLGAAVARHAMPAAGWQWSVFAWALLGAVLAAAGTNLINDYGDSRSGADEANAAAGNPFTGGSRMIQLGLLAPWQMLLASLLCFAATMVIGLHLNARLSGWALAPSPLLGIGAVGCALGVAYTVGPFALSYRGWGELAVALGFGPVIVLGSSYVLSAAAGVAWPWLGALLASAPVALFILLVLWINQFQDAPSDAASGKRNWVVRMSQLPDGGFDFGRAFAMYTALNLAGFTGIALLGALGCWNPRLATPWAWLALLALPLFLRERAQGRAWVARWRDPEADRAALPFDLLPVNAQTIAVHLSSGLLLAAAFVLAAWLG
jgi:1,4-dihydroxy-2-naphthoate octaprenyltransferase